MSFTPHRRNGKFEMRIGFLVGIIAVFWGFSANFDKIPFVAHTMENASSEGLNQHFTEVSFDRSVFRIPNEYFPSVTPFDQVRGHAAFTLALLLPDLTPAALDQAEFSRRGWVRQLRVLVEYGRHFIAQSEILTNNFEEARNAQHLRDTSSLDIQKKLANFTYLNSSHFDILDNGCKRYTGEFVFGNIMLECNDANEMFVVVCQIGDTFISVPSPSCTVVVNIGPETELTYSYSFSYYEKSVCIHK